MPSADFPEEVRVHGYVVHHGDTEFPHRGCRTGNLPVNKERP
jgi:hypothetical protein